MPVRTAEESFPMHPMVFLGHAHWILVGSDQEPVPATEQVAEDGSLVEA